MTLVREMGGDKINVWTADRCTSAGSKLTFGGEDNVFPVASLPVELWVEGNAVSSSLRDIRLALRHTNAYVTQRDQVVFTVLKVDLLVNSTAVETDDYVPKSKLPDGGRPDPVNSPAGYEDAQGEHFVPMEVKLLGPTGFSCKVKLSDTGGGDITIKRTDGSAYPAEGVTMTAGDTMEVHLYGESPSSALEDVIIHATSDKSGETELGNEDVTVIWISGGHMYFRGSGHQGEALTPGSTAKFTNFHDWEENKVGRFIYKEPMNDNEDVVYYQMELKCLVSPDTVIEDVQWDIRRDGSMAGWYGAAPRNRVVIMGETDWALNGQGEDGKDLDVTQNPGLEELFSIDGPGNISLTYVNGFAYSKKAKFREWVEVKVGNRWYICSPYKNWRCVIHLLYEDEEHGYVQDQSHDNEVVPGTIGGFAGSWDEY